MKDSNCIFCKIANGDIPSESIYEDADFKVILDMGPATKGHALILPKSHFGDLTEAEPEVTAKILPLAGKIGAAMKRSLHASGFNVVQNNGTAAGQTVFHLHVHVIPRYEKGPVMLTWQPGSSEPTELSQISETIKKELQ